MLDNLAYLLYFGACYAWRPRGHFGIARFVCLSVCLSRSAAA